MFWDNLVLFDVLLGVYVSVDDECLICYGFGVVGE